MSNKDKVKLFNKGELKVFLSSPVSWIFGGITAIIICHFLLGVSTLFVTPPTPNPTFSLLEQVHYIPLNTQGKIVDIKCQYSKECRYTISVKSKAGTKYNITTDELQLKRVW